MQDLRVTDVDVFGLSAPLEEPFGYAQAWVDERTATLVRVTASDGTVGWWECWGPIAGNRGIVEDLLAEAAVGADPLDNERLHEDLLATGRAAFQSFVPLSAVSGLDVALWDLKGRLLDQSVATLLGGRRRESVRAYATGHYFRQGLDLEERYEHVVAEAARNADGRTRLTPLEESSPGCSIRKRAHATTGDRTATEPRPRFRFETPDGDQGCFRKDNTVERGARTRYQ